jgi:hypothetical protein
MIFGKQILWDDRAREWDKRAHLRILLMELELISIPKLAIAAHPVQSFNCNILGRPAVTGSREDS